MTTPHDDARLDLESIRRRVAAARTITTADPRPGQETVALHYVTDVAALLAALDEVRSFIVAALRKAEDTTEAKVRDIAKKVDPIGIAATNYGMGVRDGVIETCRQVLAEIGRAIPAAPGVGE